MRALLAGVKIPRRHGSIAPGLAKVGIESLFLALQFACVLFVIAEFSQVASCVPFLSYGGVALLSRNVHMASSEGETFQIGRNTLNTSTDTLKYLFITSKPGSVFAEQAEVLFSFFLMLQNRACMLCLVQVSNSVCICSSM